MLLSDQHQVLVVELNLLLSSYNILWSRDNLVNNQLHDHLLDQLHFFKYYHMFLNSFFTGWSKKFCPSVITLQSFISIVGSKYRLLLVRWALFSNDKIKSLFIPWKYESIKLSKYWLCFCIDTFHWYLFQLIALLKPDFNCCNRSTLSSVDKIIMET